VKDYFDRCAAFNWHYENFDDYFGTVIPLRKVHEQLKQDATTPLLQAIYMAWYEYSHAGQPWGREAMPMPTYSDFGITE